MKSLEKDYEEYVERTGDEDTDFEEFCMAYCNTDQMEEYL
jgi:hypothetical protein